MEKKLSTVEDDFESLFEDEEDNSRTELKSLSFNDLFEAISEECEDPVKHILGDIQAGNIEDDFEALLSDESDTEVLTSDTDAQDTLNRDGEAKGFSQILSPGSSEQDAEPGHGGDCEASQGLSQKAMDESAGGKIRALTQEMSSERQLFQKQVIQYEEDKGNLREEVKNLKQSLSKIETEKNVADQKILNLEREIVELDSVAKEELKEKEEEFLFQIQTSKEKVKTQENMINELNDEICKLKEAKSNNMIEENNVHSCLESKPDDPSQKIILLEHELEDQKAVSEKLKAYVGEVLENVMISNPAVLERKQSVE